MRVSPFELKNRLVELAKHRGERMMLNAGRGNPNWLALEPRAAFFRLGEFALGESRRVALGNDLGGLPKKRGIAARLRASLSGRPEAAGSRLLLRGVEFARDALGCDPDLLVGEWVDGVLGDHYPLPVRMLQHAERIVHAHLQRELFGGKVPEGRFELFAVEGASAGITYVFQSLAHAGLLEPGARVALGVPIFSPYLEVPRLPEYRFEVVEIAQDEASGWRYPPVQLDKLRDPGVKAFLAVNPANPTAVAMDAATLEYLGAIVRERPDLILVTDDVYAPFVEGFRSLATVAPRNTIVIYSFSKFWGATGLRLGVVALHEANALDARILGGSGARYASISTAPERVKLIDRMVADSRAVGMNHTAGLSTPQQVQMALFALDALLDTDGRRKRATRAVVRERCARLYRGAGLPAPSGALLTHFYATLDVPALARSRHGDTFADWLVREHEPIEFVMRLAEERGIVLLDGGGFEAPRMSVRVSLANLPDEAYEPIGRAIVELLDDYHARWAAMR
ncbi:MAG: bifunctional aspartate transaminase/aspartate 4-decarboxylase [Betaproteobacteria bacterium]|nr:bifunctional aspartate transaminase/aspartate 4-decarboxylase [Betaproteobacteria bacterium]MDH5220803.1 bifunctional aspartate transaminase/aspartate 4-decarboxylase [Betaproteobacteria bacterium]